MATYIILNLIFLSVVTLALRIKWRRPSKAWWVTLGVSIVLTAIFDSVIVGTNIVAYNPDNILGITIGTAPIEDFFYAIAASVIVPTIWMKLSFKKEQKKS